MRRVLLSILAFAVVTVFTSSVAFASSANPGVGLEEGTLDVAFTDGAGASRTTPFFAGTPVTPGMDAVESEIAVENLGDRAARHIVEVATEDDRPMAPLAQVLMVDVREADSGRLVYQGPVDSLRFAADTDLAPGAVAGYRLSITWPSTPADAGFQGAQAGFGLVVHAVTADRA